MDKNINAHKISLGTCYYPEHWHESLWESDIDTMLEHGIETVRIAEFAWSKFEPTEGNFTYEFFDKFLDLCAKKSMKVIFCTPTATPPAWLSHKYPEILNADREGNLYSHGQRRHYNYNSPKYIELTSIVVEKIASHYAAHPSIIGWQLDNEFNCEINEFYSESDHEAYVSFLKDKYKSLENLNDAWGNVFWNQEYTDWEQVRLSGKTPSKSPNPHGLLDEKRFFSYSAIKFAKIQADIIRKYLSDGQFITTNGVFGHLDNHKLTQDILDFMTLDNYPNFNFSIDKKLSDKNEFMDRYASWNLTKIRSISENFGIMEQQSGAGGWVNAMAQPMPKPGQMRLWTLQAIAHGADFISYFRWRTCGYGTEIYWHGLNDYSNKINRRLVELKQTYSDIQKIEHIAGAKNRANIAIMRDYDNELDGEWDIWHGPLDNSSVNAWFVGLQKHHIPFDFLYLRENSAVNDLLKYEIIVYPHPTIFTKAQADLIKQYTCRGGKIIFGARTGYKDEFGRCPMRDIGGYSIDITGAEVVDYTAISAFDEAQYALWNGINLEVAGFADILMPVGENAETLATFTSDFYKSNPALIKTTYNGGGAAYYFGGGFSENTVNGFIENLDIKSPIENLIILPPELEVTIREKNGKKYYFIINYANISANFTVCDEMIDLLTGGYAIGNISLLPYGVMVLEK